MSFPLPRALLYLTAGAIGVFAIADSRRADPVLEAARQAFDVYQDALFAGDRPGQAGIEFGQIDGVPGSHDFRQ